MSLVRSLISSSVEESYNDYDYEYAETGSMETYYADAACENLVRDIFKTEQAFYTADIMGEVAVIQEGADPEVLLEGVVSGAFEKLKAGFKKFIAKIKEWLNRVMIFFKTLFIKGKDLVKNYKKQIMDKEHKYFKYKGYSYKIGTGDSLVDGYNSKCDTEITKLLDVKDIASARSYNVDDNKSAYSSTTSDYEKPVSSAVSGLTTKTSQTDYQDKFVKTLEKGCENVGELSKLIEETYRNKDTEKSEITGFSANSREEMMSFLEKFDKATGDIKKDQKKFEDDVNKVIKQLDTLAGKTQVDDKSKSTTYYKTASKVSSYVSAALAVKKTVVDAKIKMMKEINSAFTQTLKAFLVRKEVKESAFFEEFDDLIALTEGEVPEPDPEDLADDVEEGCGGKRAYESYYDGYDSYSDYNNDPRSLLESAYNYL